VCTDQQYTWRSTISELRGRGVQSAALGQLEALLLQALASAVAHSAGAHIALHNAGAMQVRCRCMFCCRGDVSAQHLRAMRGTCGRNICERCVAPADNSRLR
jgi:hypothetical protein